jgi:hypothetical protein
MEFALAEKPLFLKFFGLIHFIGFMYWLWHKMFFGSRRTRLLQESLASWLVKNLGRARIRRGNDCTEGEIDGGNDGRGD